MEDFYSELARAGASRPALPLELDLSRIPFVPPDGLLALVCAARLWHKWTGCQTILTGMHSEVHKYLERMDLFTKCADWLSQDHELPLVDRYDRSPQSNRLLEVIPISGDEEQNSRDVGMAVRRAEHILSSWFHADARAVGRLTTVLAEIGSNVTHSLDRGFAVIQRYNDHSSPGLGSRVTVAIADLGIGIEKSLCSKPRLRQFAHQPILSGSDYILLALQLGVSSRDTVAGTGLPRIKNIVENWSGCLTIRSYHSMVRFERGECVIRDNLVEIPGTQVTITVRGSLGANFAL